MINFQNVDKMKFNKIGVCFEPTKVFGKITNKFRCPNCREVLEIHKRKGTIKLKCPKCSYQNISKDIFRRNKNDINKQISIFYENF